MMADVATAYPARGKRRRRVTPLRLMTGGLLFAVLATVALWWIAGRWTPSREAYPVQGIAVSADNGEIDWLTLQTGGADFVYMQATAGSEGRDPAFARNWAGARGAGMRYGAIHRFSLCRRAGVQAQLFIASVPRDNAALPPVAALDFDEGCTARPDRSLVLSELNTFLNEIEAHSGKAAVLRISQPFDAAYDVSGRINRTVWLVRNLLEPGYAAHPWVMWTANGWRRVPGAEGRVGWTVVKP
jgi:lysozyme